MNFFASLPRRHAAAQAIKNEILSLLATSRILFPLPPNCAIPAPTPCQASSGTVIRIDGEKQEHGLTGKHGAGGDEASEKGEGAARVIGEVAEVVED